MKAYLTYALNNEGDLVHIDSVPNGNECGCICPHCKSELCAKNGGSGEKMVHHFAHSSGSDCVGAIESALHKMAKDVMKETLSLQLPERLDGSRGEVLRFDRVEVEFFDKETRLRPDCIGYYGDKILWIEFKRTHAVDAKKKGKIISAKIDCVELDLNSCSLDPESVRKFITEEIDHRIWIRDTKSKPRFAGSYGSNQSYDDCINYVHIQRVFAEDEHGHLVNLLKDNFDMNAHSYYCLACGKELTIDVNEVGQYVFVHVDKSCHCEDDLYLHEAAKDIIQHKFSISNDFSLLIPQYQKCSAKDNCTLFLEDACSKGKGILYNLKDYGYNESIKNYKLPNYGYKCDLVIKKADSYKDAIIISINAGDCHIDVNTEEYRVIEVEVLNESVLLDLLEHPIDMSHSTFINFKRDNGKTAPRSEMDRRILKFSLFSSGKYHMEPVLCDKLEEHKFSTVLEHIFVEGVRNVHDAKWYSLLKCREQKRKVCLCEICWFLTKINGFYINQTICKRYKTKGTPHYPLESMPVDCPFFCIDKEIESMAKLNYGDVKVIEKVYEK